jgi:hypothetical protein
MTSQPTKSKRFRLRFSVRTLVIVVTLVCCYAACWGPTKTSGVQDTNHWLQDQWFREFTTKSDPPWYVWRQGSEAVAIAPLLLRLRADTVMSGPRDLYYFWFFGYVAKLPCEREL